MVLYAQLLLAVLVAVSVGFIWTAIRHVDWHQGHAIPRDRRAELDRRMYAAMAPALARRHPRRPIAPHHHHHISPLVG